MAVKLFSWYVERIQILYLYRRIKFYSASVYGIYKRYPHSCLINVVILYTSSAVGQNNFGTYNMDQNRNCISLVNGCSKCRGQAHSYWKSNMRVCLIKVTEVETPSPQFNLSQSSLKIIEVASRKAVTFSAKLILE